MPLYSWSQRRLLHRRLPRLENLPPELSPAGMTPGSSVPVGRKMSWSGLRSACQVRLAVSIKNNQRCTFHKPTTTGHYLSSLSFLAQHITIQNPNAHLVGVSKIVANNSRPYRSIVHSQGEDRQPKWRPSSLTCCGPHFIGCMEFPQYRRFRTSFSNRLVFRYTVGVRISSYWKYHFRLDLRRAKCSAVIMVRSRQTSKKSSFLSGTSSPHFRRVEQIGGAQAPTPVSKHIACQGGH